MAKKSVIKSVRKKVKATAKWVRPETKQGGFSNALWNSTECQNYVTSSVVAGYFGNSYRTIMRDRVIEIELKAAGLGDEGAACWLTSTSARHMMDSVDRHTKLEDFTHTVKSNVRDAFVEVTIWSHPDFGYNMASRIEMIYKLREKLAKY